MRMLRRFRLSMVAGVGALLLGVAVLPGWTSAAPAACGPGQTQMRAVWIATVGNIDWPSRPGLNAADQQREYRAILDNAVRLRLNTVIVQIRPTADAFWPGSPEPWSRWLSGAQGGDPGYDPLAFLVGEAHARGLAFHAWFNPFRVGKESEAAQLVPDHPARLHPDWVFTYAGQVYYDPGKPEVREFVTNIVTSVVQHYDIDAVHLDDYFYPYPDGSAAIPDEATFAAHHAGFTDVADWRRDNVDRFVQGMSQRIHAAKPGVGFGVSPFGVWRNAGEDPRGSATRASVTSFDATYADTLTWIQKGWIDYVVPQLYWNIGFEKADYATLVRWWAGAVAGTRVQLYIGQAAYKVGTTPEWGDGELNEHLKLNQQYPEVGGDVYFSAVSLTSNAAAAIDQVAADHYPSPVPSPRC